MSGWGVCTTSTNQMLRKTFVHGRWGGLCLEQRTAPSHPHTYTPFLGRHAAAASNHARLATQQPQKLNPGTPKSCKHSVQTLCAPNHEPPPVGLWAAHYMCVGVKSCGKGTDQARGHSTQGPLAAAVVGTQPRRGCAYRITAAHCCCCRCCWRGHPLPLLAQAAIAAAHEQSLLLLGRAGAPAGPPLHAADVTSEPIEAVEGLSRRRTSHTASPSAARCSCAAARPPSSSRATRLLQLP